MKSSADSRSKYLLKLLLVYSRRAQSSESGFVVVMAMAMVLILSLLALSYAMLSKVDTFTQDASAKSKTGFYAAEAGLNIRAKSIRDTFQDYNRPSGTSPADFAACLDTSTSNDGTGHFACSQKTFQGHVTASYATELPNNPALITINEGEVYRGLTAQEYRYDLLSTSFDKENLPTTILGMRFKSRLVPLFQFAAFYNKDLEILPGPNMTLNGPVHTNGDLYLNSDNSLTINGQVTVSGDFYRGRKNNTNCTGTVRVYDPTNPTNVNCNSGRSQITDVASWNGLIRLENDKLQLPPEGMLNPVQGAIYWDRADLRVVLRLDSSGNPAAIEVRNANNTTDTTRTNALLNSCTVPSTTLTANSPVHATNGSTNAQLQVASTSGFNEGDALTVGTDIDSNVITGQYNASINGINGNTISLKRKFARTNQTTAVPIGAAVRKAVVSTSDTFYNYREGKYIRMLEVDLQELLNCAHQNSLLDSSKALNDSTDGGLVFYFTVEGPNSSIDMTGSSPPSDGNNYGVRIRNGREIRSTVAGAPTPLGLTIVTDQAMYVYGSFNADNKKPASFLADTINVLSDSCYNPSGGCTLAGWLLDDSRSRNYDSNNLPSSASNLTVRRVPVTDTSTDTPKTIINAAFLSGTDTTGGPTGEGTAGQNGAYNGGLENYPRFHENWDNHVLVYRGSFVSLNRPRKVDGAWTGTGGSYYNPPKRVWDYDLDYNNAANLPPLSPRFVYLKQEVFSRDFER